MELRNYTPFPVGTWTSLESDGRERGVLLVRGCLRMLADRAEPALALRLEDDQGALFAEDRFHGEVGRSSVRFESDFVAYKPRTDLILNATACSPAGTPRPRWLCAVLVQASDGTVLLNKPLQVHGERFWQRGWRGWSLSAALPCDQVPIRYELAYGGALRGPPDADGNPGPWLDFCDRNPLGRGLVHRDYKAREVPAPRIDDPGQPVSDPYRPYAPQGFGAIHRAWQPRLALAGTYDEAWLARKHPLPPDDFDPGHNHGANPDLVGAGRARGYLRGDETLRLHHLLPERADCALTLPRYRLLARLRYPGGIDTHQLLPLDTLVLDLDPPDPAERKLYLSWRTRFAVIPEPQQIEVMLLKPEPGREGSNG